MRIVALPAGADPGDLADWLEIKALAADDGDASRGDLESALRPSPGFTERSADDVDRIVTDTFSEIRLRQTAASRGYPFDVDEDLLLSTRPDAWTDRSSYLLCLCLSWFGFAATRGVDAKPERIFEDLSVAVARNYLGGEAVRFGSPRVPVELPASFRVAVTRLAQELLREGGAASDQRLHWTKDDGLDVVAWRDHPDGGPGKLILFGACAAGDNWETKVMELNPVAWVQNWMVRPPTVAPVKAFFLPHRIRDRWEYHTRRAGMLFDRCRIASWAPKLPAAAHHGDGIGWAQALVDGLPEL